MFLKIGFKKAGGKAKAEKQQTNVTINQGKN